MSSPDNEGTSTVDLVMLIGMPIVIAVLIGIVWWLGADLQNLRDVTPPV